MEEKLSAKIIPFNRNFQSRTPISLVHPIITHPLSPTHNTLLLALPPIPPLPKPPILPPPIRRLTEREQQNRRAQGYVSIARNDSSRGISVRTVPYYNY